MSVFMVDPFLVFMAVWVEGALSSPAHAVIRSPG